MDFQFIGHLIAGVVILGALAAICVLVEWEAQGQEEQRRERKRAEIAALHQARIQAPTDVRA